MPTHSALVLVSILVQDIRLPASQTFSDSGVTTTLRGATAAATMHYVAYLLLSGNSVNHRIEAEQLKNI